jgi:hypothetical protein
VLEGTAEPLRACCTQRLQFVELCAKLRAELDDDAAAQHALSRLAASTAGLLVRP